MVSNLYHARLKTFKRLTIFLTLMFSVMFMITFSNIPKTQGNRYMEQRKERGQNPAVI